VIYLDHNATTPVDQRVVAAILPYFTLQFANASSVDHEPGNVARRAVEAARAAVASLIRAEPEEIVFTSGATEADNIAVCGTMARAGDDAELVVSAIEHPAVLEPARTFGSRLRVVPVDGAGVVDVAALRSAIGPRTALVSVMAANNETGAIQPLDEIGRVCAEFDVPLHVDATQAAARMPIDVKALNIALLSLSAHKMYGPKGVGVLFVRRRPRVRVAPVMLGGGHERNLRPGTLNVPGIVGLAEAAALVSREGPDDWRRERSLRDRLLTRLCDRGPTEVVQNVPTELCLPQTLSVRFVGVTARALLRSVVQEIAMAAGSACSTTSVEPSHVLLAQGLSSVAIAESVRISFGRQTTGEEIDQAADLIVGSLARLSKLRHAA
jgi:cysteine desulfurase